MCVNRTTLYPVSIAFCLFSRQPDIHSGEDHRYTIWKWTNWIQDKVGRVWRTNFRKRRKHFIKRAYFSVLWSKEGEINGINFPMFSLSFDQTYSQKFPPKIHKQTRFQSIVTDVFFFFVTFFFRKFVLHTLIGELIGYSWSGVWPSLTISSVFSKTASPIKAKFYVEPPWVRGTKVCMRHLSHPSKIFLSGTGWPISTKPGM